MQTSGFWLKLGGEFFQPCSRFLRVFEMMFFPIKPAFSAAGTQCLVWLGAGGTGFTMSPFFHSQDGSLQCPTCKTIYGVKTGTQPPGKMEYHIIPHALPGHADCKTIRIIYNIPPGVQVGLGGHVGGLSALVTALSPQVLLQLMP